MAVCQSHSGLPCGGFYTNVFSDSTCPTILATITAFGHGAVSHPPSSSRSAIAAVWDQNGGFICDHLGNITKEWHWQTTSTPREKIIIQLSALISVRLLSGTSAMLIFRCNNESVQLPLSALSDINQSEMPYLKSDGRFTSNAALELLVRKSKRNMTLTPVSGCSQKVLQMVRAVEGLEELSARWRRGGSGDRELKRLQQRVRETLDDWLDYYRAAIGIKCPDTERKPDVPLRTRVRREVQSAALPSLNQPHWADVKTVQSENGSNELQELQRQPSAPAERPPDSSIRLPRSTLHKSTQGQAAAPSQKWTVTWTPYKRVKEEPCVTQIGPLQIHGNIKPESVVIAKSPESPPSTANCCPAPLLFTPSIPLTVCPVLLRSALLREGGRRRCCCSATLMPVVTDLEYDALVMGQPPHSQQILVVCVTLLHQPNQAVPDHGTLEHLYRRRNKHRTMPCTQCQMDAFRMVRYEISTVESGCGVQNILLQQRHHAAPGMILMYIRGKLLFVGYICSDHSFSARDLQKQISRTRRDYRLGLDLPPDYKFSDTVNIADRCKQLTRCNTYTEEADIIHSASVESQRKNRKNR
ncbi:uncharacterized protein C3orf20-like isoform X2 [Mastacembelus armatus]|uniref:uncharacterized protein C3orf20-like isoform X2 n=1 Tax=Mastacembelus armatus TaxID=205130 RepID=UPI000E45FADC|nr:uncharacterized protein C3orf20 homolog isoform X2 [Mastacembelus armatus]